MAAHEDILIFVVGKQRYGLLVDQLSEIIQMVAITELPDLPEGMLGIINYRGVVTPLIDLRQMLNMPAQNIHLNSLIVVAKTLEGKLGLLVDGIEGVKTLPFVLEPVVNPHIVGILRHADEMILMLDLKSLAIPMDALSIS